MLLQIQEIGVEGLSRYAQVPSRFVVDSVLRTEVIDQGLGGFRLVEEKVDPPYVKDYDAVEEDSPIDWPRQFDVSRWGFFLALDGGREVGAAAVAMDSPGVHMLERRPDLGVLWDIRVHPDEWGHGVGAALFRHAADWARKKGCRQFKVETQNVNVRACRFYVRQGCVLGAINRYGYAGCPEVAHEVMLLWYLDL